MAQVQGLAQSAAPGSGKMTFAKFLPKEANNLKFFSYMGSLTTPGCSQIVKWTVFLDIMPIFTEQVRSFCMGA